MHKPKRNRIALLVNVVAPYRKPIYEALAEEFELRIITGGTEAGKVSWDGSPEIKGALQVEAWGWTFRWAQRQRDSGLTVDYRALQIQPGYIAELSRFRPDAIITLEMGFRTLVALAYGKAMSVPVWVWWEGTRFTERNIGPVKRFIRRLISRADARWLTCGETSIEYLVHLGVSPESIVQVTNTVEDTLFSTEIEPGFSFAPHPVVLSVGRMVAQKGFEKLLQSAKRLDNAGFVFSLVLVGDGPEKERLRRLAQDLGLKQVRFCDAVHYRTMPGLYRSADSFIFPTLSDTWGFVVNEALLCGLPVACSVYAGCQQLVHPAALFDPLDPEDFDRVLSQAVRGELPAADSARIPRASDVWHRLTQEIRSRLEP